MFCVEKMFISHSIYITHIPKEAWTYQNTKWDQIEKKQNKIDSSNLEKLVEKYDSYFIT